MRGDRARYSLRIAGVAKLRISAPFRAKDRHGALFNHLALFEHDNPVAFANSGQTGVRWSASASALRA